MGEKVESEQWILEYRQAYRDANQTDIAPTVTYHGGGWWALYDGVRHKFRRKTIEGLTARLRARVPTLQSKHQEPE